MITIEQDQVTFKFSHINAQLQEQAERFIKEWTPRILAEDKAAVASRLIEQMGVRSEEQARAFRDKLNKLSPDDIASKFAELVKSRCQLSGRTSIDFQRTLRLPDDGNDYPLPPGLGSFPLRQVEGRTIMPMYQAEAMWMSFDVSYPVALKIGTGTINAANGEKWSEGLQRDPQSYVVLPEQPWLDGYCVEKGVVRQFVAARLGDGYTAEEQLESSQEGGIRLEAVPLKPEAYFTKHLADELPRSLEDFLRGEYDFPGAEGVCFSLADRCCESPAMGLGAGGRMKQEIYEDQWEAADWDLGMAQEAKVEICDAVRWLELTGQVPPTEPVTAKTYSEYGLPWFDFYRDDMEALESTGRLESLKSVQEKARQAGDESMPIDESVNPDLVVQPGTLK
jgi:hypothetical protein